jgi:hypothetical protein
MMTDVVMEMETGKAVFTAPALEPNPKVRKFSDVPELMLKKAKEMETLKRENAAAGRKDPELLADLARLWGTIRETQVRASRERREFELEKQAKARAKEAARPNHVA